MASRGLQRLSLKPASRVLDVHSQRFFDRELPPELRTPAFASFSHRQYSKSQLAWALSAWQQRALDEYRSLVGLAQYLDELGSLGLAFDAVATAVRVVRDEARHVELCRRMVRALGGSDVIPGAPTYVRSNPRAPLLERVMTTTLGSLCIGETFSVALLAASRDRAVDPLAHAVLTQLTADESVHSQLGWTLLPMLWPSAAVSLRKKLLASVEASLRYAAAVVLEEGSPASERNPFGDLFPHERAHVFARQTRMIRKRLRKLAG